MGNKKKHQPADCTVEIVDSSYQPSKAQLEVDVSIDASPDDVARALTRTVNVQRVNQSKAASAKSRSKKT